MDDIRIPVPAGSTRFMDQLRADMRARGYALPTERTYLHWIRRYILFNQRRHPGEMGQAEIENFLNHLAVVATVSPSTQRTALNALMYLYTKYLRREPQTLSFKYARPTRRLPTVLTREEAKDIISHLSGTPRLRTDFRPRYRKPWPCINRTSPTATARCTCPTRWNVNIPLRPVAPHGSFYSPLRASAPTRAPASFAATIYTIRRCANISGLR
jgi:integrase